ncbi:MAG TPA: zf-HC2 domain-containing protein [Gemmatimonadales bacterium]
MNHLDEGTIAELLDRGLRQADDRRAIERHLDACAECRTRVDEARHMLERARAILLQSGPADIEPPPFEQIATRAGYRRRRRWRPSRPLALAATAVLAIGVTWAAGEFVTWTPSPGEPAGVPAGGQMVPWVNEPAAAGSSMAQRVPPVAAAPETPPIESPPAVAPLAARDVAGVASGAGPGARAERLAAAPPPAAAPAGAQQRDAAADRTTEESRRAALGRAVLSEQAALPTLDDRGWTVVARADAERLLGGPVYVIEGLRIIDHAMRAVAPVAVRTRLALDDGAVIALVQSPRTDEAAPRAGQPAVSTGQPQVDLGEFRVTVSGPIPSDSLRALLARLRR